MIRVHQSSNVESAATPTENAKAPAWMASSPDVDVQYNRGLWISYRSRHKLRRFPLEDNLFFDKKRNLMEDNPLSQAKSAICNYLVLLSSGPFHVHALINLQIRQAQMKSRGGGDGRTVMSFRENQLSNSRRPARARHVEHFHTE